MGFSEDNVDVYKFDVSSTGIPTDKHPWESGSGNGPALSSGVVELRCFINPKCPFVKRPSREEAVVFNSSTLSKKTIETYFPDYFKNLMTTTPYMEGLHFRPKYVYRHNYVYYYDPTISGGSDHLDYRLANFDEFYKEISGNNLLHQEHTRYRDDQSWIIVPSVFEGYYEKLKNTRGLSDSPGLSAEICDFSSLWKYSTRSFPSEAEEYDIMMDYEYDFYKEHKDDIPPNLVSMPGQRFSSIYRTGGPGIHWRLLKKTELYKGEDFFVEFHKSEDSEDVRKTEKKVYPFNVSPYSAYASLDFTYDPDLRTNRVQTTEGDSEPFNSAVLSGEKGKGKTFDFTDQPYYIIELGYRNPEDNYFIIICSRSAPIFVHFDKYGVSRRLSEHPNVFGEELIKSKGGFRMTVRNYLGKLAITFDVTGKRPSEPWIIERFDKEDSNEQRGSTDIIKELVVPRGQMTLWGGNLLTSFVFGPLQYRGRGIRFVYPPDKASSQSDEGTIVHQVDQAEIVPLPPFLSLPSETNHHYKLAMSNVDPLNFSSRYSSVNIPGISREDGEMFTQDAQFYKEFNVSYNQRRNAYGGSASDWNYGSFFFGHTSKDLFNLQGGEAPGINDSTIELERHSRVEIDERRKIHKFSLRITMGLGDHVFDRNDSSVNFRAEPIQSGDIDLSIPEDHNYGDDRWIVLSCKTPILTQIRLVSDENSDSRWEDGTSANYRGLPLGGNPYFIDASDHILDYNDTWSAPDFYSIEHTGTISFILNKNLRFGDPAGRGRPNITEELFNLQNKTFYVEIWAGYSRTETRVEGEGERQSNYTRIPGLYRLFTGLCHGGEVQYSYGKRIMSCKIEDYSKVLKDQLFFNSPFFDGMKDVFAIYEILKMASFSSIGNFDPASILKILTENVDDDTIEYWTDIDKRSFKSKPYVLPAEYERLNQAAFRFKSGSNYYDAIHEMAKRAAKVFYFDQFGIAHFEDFLDMIIDSLTGGEDLIPMFEFTQNPEYHVGQMVFNKVDHAYNVRDVVNHIKMITTSPARELLIGDYLNYEGIENPNTEGFMGYLKTFLQQEGMFGSEKATKQIMDFYLVMFKPPVTYVFETYGLPIRALDIVSVNGHTSRVSVVKHNINPQENRWWMNVETERFQPVVENYSNEPASTP